jgi:hypothetical protein
VSIVEVDVDEDGGLLDHGVFLARGVHVLLASRVAAHFGVETRVVNQAVKRNPFKFKEKHCFQLTFGELDALRSQGVMSKPGRGGSRAAPWVFTLKGVLRLATVLDTPRALEATDDLIDLFFEVRGQISARSRSTEPVAAPQPVAISQPSRFFLPSAVGDKIGKLRERMIDALERILDSIIDPVSERTVRDELGDLTSGIMSHVKEHLRTKGLENEKIEAEILLILEKVKEVRERTSADTARIRAETQGLVLANIDRRIAILERLAKMIDANEPSALALLGMEFDREIAPPTWTHQSLDDDDDLRDG